MKQPRDRGRIDWRHVEAELDQEGYAVLPGLLRLSPGDLARMRTDALLESLDSGHLGQGSLCVLPRHLPSVLQDLRDLLYRGLVPVANRWNELLGRNVTCPSELSELVDRSRPSRLNRSPGSLTVLRDGDYLALHQRSDGTEVFPLEAVALLSQPGRDFTGGEFVMVEQRPRMQSRPIVVPLSPGSVAIIASGERPQRGTKGHYRVNLRHAISRVRGGERIGLEFLLATR
jgi:hypothetical protein